MTAPLAGRAVLVTRPIHQAGGLAQAIRAAGGEAVVFPALTIEPVPAAELAGPLAQLADADIAIFVSPNAAQFGMAAIGTLPAGVVVFAVGPGTARALAAQGVSGVITPGGFPLPRAGAHPEGHTGAGVGRHPPKPISHDSEALLALPALQAVAGKRAVIVRGVGGRPLLADTLAARGAAVHFLECYRRGRPAADAAPLAARWRAGGIDAVTAASAETLANLATLLGEDGRALLAVTPLFVPHEKIAAAARRFGMTRVVATAGGDAGLIEGVINWFRNPA